MKPNNKYSFGNGTSVEAKLNHRLCELITLCSLLLVKACIKHEWTSEGMLKDTVQLNEMQIMSHNHSISVSTVERHQ